MSKFNYNLRSSKKRPYSSIEQKSEYHPSKKLKLNDINNCIDIDIKNIDGDKYFITYHNNITNTTQWKVLTGTDLSKLYNLGEFDSYINNSYKNFSKLDILLKPLNNFKKENLNVILLTPRNKKLVF
jgi:hypothetical protein